MKYDVIIMGGGPGGATLATFLARDQGMRVLVLERERFPREHIGESLSHRVIPVLEESGALGKVLESGCGLRKYGGYYAWNPPPPRAILFEQEAAERDGAKRWALHVNRAEFDHILVEHARSCGAEVREESPVSGVERDGDAWVVAVAGQPPVRATWFIEAAGRRTSMITGQTRWQASDYDNIALWTHVVDGRPAESLEGDWNVFRAEGLSPIGSFAFEHGWCWYIPVPRTIDGERVVTHSLGVVTTPEYVAREGARLREARGLVALARGVPLLGELVRDARPLTVSSHAAANYSRISEQLCSYEERWLLLGDSAYFVDPLFSSGVAFALNQAAAAATLLGWTSRREAPESDLREGWRDYDWGWRRLARSFALAIDQWYHAIRKAYPGSVYWNGRADRPLGIAGLQDDTFAALVDTNVSPDLLHVLTRGSQRYEDLDQSGPLVRNRRSGTPTFDAGTRIRLRTGVRMRPSVTLDLPRAKAVSAPGSSDTGPARYWQDPLANANAVPPLYSAPRRCFRFGSPGGHVGVRFDDEADGRALEAQLVDGAGAVFGELDAKLSVAQRGLLSQLAAAGMITVVS